VELTRTGLNDDCFLYVGTYTHKGSKGIYAYRFSISTGKLTRIGLVAEMVNPSFLAVHPSLRFVYAVSESSPGLVKAYRIDRETGTLTLLNRAESHGSGPCHLAVDRTGRIAIASNYTGGSLALIRVCEDGSLKDLKIFRKDLGASADKPRPHGACLSPDNRFVVVPDCALNKLFVYRLDPDKGLLEEAATPFVNLQPGAGPRHFAFHPSGRYGYVVNESDSTVTAFHYDPVRGFLEPFDTVSTLTQDFRGGNLAAELEVDGSGRFVYCSNRGANTIATFAIDSIGSLDIVEHMPALGRTPRHFAIDPTGLYLLIANQDSDNIVVFRRDQKTGRLTATEQATQACAPTCLVFVTRP
jgi:6-phosphogluconolactonase